MATTRPEGEGAHEQHNHGSGTFIGRDNYGDVHNEMVDPKTKALLAKMTVQAPSLAKLLDQALRDGVISPDTVNALARAARNINEDVASALREAGRNINEDVARSLMFAGKSINPTVADQILRATEILSKATQGLSIDDLHKVAYRFERTKESLNGSAGTLERLESGTGPFSRIDTITSALNSAAERIERVVTPPPPKIIIDREATVKSFLLGGRSRNDSDRRLPDSALIQVRLPTLCGTAPGRLVT
ncbi:hypothetical protein [Streptomyces caeruleatus]|uniref:Uncharacterized protein n=1 Tax=Streptomyces caeruleatus TaxID=661399 RepID=A0A117RJE8_9ACTN|nr:hypothetical protein [Streptomyces caeruleatus]KUN94079.1 hypothetical protein AQJ67_37630 [Streptomyces caeruleatus]